MKGSSTAKILGLLKWKSSILLLVTYFSDSRKSWGKKKISFLKHIIEKCIADNNTLECYFSSKKKKRKKHTSIFVFLGKSVMAIKKVERDRDSYIFILQSIRNGWQLVDSGVDNFFNTSFFFHYQCRRSTTVHKIIFSLVVYVCSMYNIWTKTFWGVWWFMLLHKCWKLKVTIN